MKKFTISIFVFFSSTCCFSQTLIQGVYSTVVLHTNIATENPQPDTTCPSYEFSFFDNCFPYVTGMNLYIRIDSINGPSNSVRFKDNLSVNTIVQANDTILITPNPSTITMYVIFYNTATLYTSLIASGIPQNANDSFYCNYSHSVGYVYDGCGGGQMVCAYSGGNGTFDSIKSCYVVPGTVYITETMTNTFSVYPRLTKDNITIEHLNFARGFELYIYNVHGQLLLQQKMTQKKTVVDLNMLKKGVYLLKLFDKVNLYTTKIIKE